jgi:uncharacterized membrane protein YGL010W
MTRLLNWPLLRDDYATYHTTAGNRACHIIGIPLIMLAVIRWTMVGFVPLTAVFIPVYVLWHPGLGLAMGAVIGAMAWASLYLPVWAAPAAFVLGWIFQLVGHAYYEKKSPAFADNLVHVLVGPMWVLKEVLRYK